VNRQEIWRRLSYIWSDHPNIGLEGLRYQGRWDLLRDWNKGLRSINQECYRQPSPLTNLQRHFPNGMRDSILRFEAMLVLWQFAVADVMTFVWPGHSEKNISVLNMDLQYEFQKYLTVSIYVYICAIFDRIGKWTFLRVGPPVKKAELQQHVSADWFALSHHVALQPPTRWH
jgi:hypothetical protein